MKNEVYYLYEIHDYGKHEDFLFYIYCNDVAFVVLFVIFATMLHLCLIHKKTGDITST